MPVPTEKEPCSVSMPGWLYEKIQSEPSSAYFLDGATYCKAAENQMAMPTLFSLIKQSTHERATHA